MSSQTLQLRFVTEFGNNATVSISTPKYPADAEEVQAAMETMIANDEFKRSGGQLAEIRDARIVSRDVEDIEFED
ncbi:Protein of unknown function (DUF2922) [Salsuginibacillus halophilus]|uniref:DUF2922 family protein n=1 Tax=Salsuginibacillus halophilus TaxID=517424 RepID=A0A2P8H4Y8_9BACI|nr:DUF2922 domain-containing protein [Salsuginibacillus halophilus]PSL41281.1 Protein of unknown function (DUF2922) [Salsuginibacillus halophilus]